MFHVKHRQETSPDRVFDRQPGVGYKASVLENFQMDARFDEGSRPQTNRCPTAITQSASRAAFRQPALLSVNASARRDI